MWYPASIIAPAAAEPVSLSSVKRRCRVDHDDDDEILSDMIAEARDYVEKYCNIKVSAQTVVVKCDSFSDFARFPLAPAQSVESISYIDAKGDQQTLDSAVYEARFEGLEPAIVLRGGKSWPPIQAGSRITVSAVVGYSCAPEAIIAAMHLHIADAYDTRENAKSEEWTAVDRLLSNYRRGV